MARQRSQRGHVAGFADKGMVNSINDVMTLFASGRDIRADRTEGISARVSAEGAGDFLFDLYHSDISFY